jgi:WD40 repeat protein
MRKLVAFALVLVVVSAGLNAAPPPKPPAKPAVNPGVAKLLQTAADLGVPLHAIAYREAGGLLLAAGDEGQLRYWTRDADGWKLAESKPHVLPGHQGPMLALAAAGNTIASGGADGKVLLWSLPGDKIARTLNAGTVVRAVALDPMGKTVAAAGDDGVVHLWNTANGQAGRKLTGATDWLRALAFSPDGKTLAAGGYDGRLRLWDVGSGKKLVDVLAQPPAPPKTTQPLNVVTALAFSADGKQIAVGGSEPRLHLFQKADGKLIRSLTGHTGAITGLVFHPDGKHLISSSKDRSLRLWNPANGQMLKTLEGHTAWAEGVTLLDQGTHLASAGADQTVRLWTLIPETTKPAKKKK